MATPEQTPSANAFELLDCDPDAPWTLQSLQASRDEARLRWSSEANRGVGPSATLARLRREQLAQLKDVFTSEEELRRHGEEARRRRSERRKRLRLALQQEMAFAALADDIPAALIERWAKTYQEVVSRAEIEASMAGLHLPEHSSDALSAPRLREIDEQLDLLGLASLYALVGVTEPPASREDALRAAKATAEVAHHKAQRSAEWTVRKELASRAQTIFGSAEQSQEYLEHWRQEEFYRRFVKPFEATCDASDKLGVAQVTFLLQQAEAAGMSQSEALELLFRVAYARKWRMAPPRAMGDAPDADMRQQLAHYQAAYTAEQARRERAEREKVAADRRQRESERQARESRRAVNSANDELEVARRRALEQHAKVADLEEQIRKVDARAQRGDARYEQAKAEAERLRLQLADAQRQNAAETQQRITELAPRLQRLLTNAELVAAQAIIKSFETVPSQWADDAKRIESGIAQAKRYLDEAHRAAVRPSQREELIARALGECRDYQPALIERDRHPPLPPSDLRATADERGVSLAWQPSVSSGVAYAVVRKAVTTPASAQDGEWLETTPDSTWRDSKPVLGRPVWYAIFAVRGKLASEGAAAQDAPLTLTPDVAGVWVDVSDETLTLRWTTPEVCAAVNVVRREGTGPQSMRDGVSQVVRDA
ncbi:MAG TPA: hypothetical protein VGR57_16380, partial [Ktedonobacterales bacterium]|nr:hypothetical protein [Ktedonobacterales bacterium]